MYMKKWRLKTEFEDGLCVYEKCARVVIERKGDP